MSESSFPPFSAEKPYAWLHGSQRQDNGSQQQDQRLVHAAVTPTPFNRALAVVTGGGAFYDFNLDFGCCFGHVTPPWVPDIKKKFPDITSSDEILLQRPRYRTVLVNGSTYGVRFYPLNAEQDFGEAHAEVAYSSNVTVYGSKSENNFVVMWIRDSDSVTIHGYSGNASPFANDTKYHAGFIGGPSDYRQYMPSLFRVQRSTNVRFANLVGAGGRIGPSNFVAAGNFTDPQTWNMVLRQDGEGICDADKTPKLCATSRVLDRPVLWEWSGKN
jgi:hypothetical protein